MRFHTPGTLLPFFLAIQQPGFWEHFLLSPTARSWKLCHHEGYLHVATGDSGDGPCEPGAQRPWGEAGVHAGGTPPGAGPARQQLRFRVPPSPAFRAAALLCPQMGVQTSCKDSFLGGKEVEQRGSPCYQNAQVQPSGFGADTRPYSQSCWPQKAGGSLQAGGSSV